MLLKHWAQKQGISYRTALRWYREDRLPVPAWQYAPGHSIVVVSETDKVGGNGVHLYARVSSHDQKSDLARQRERLETYAAAQGWKILSVTEEIGSGLNGKRTKLQRILRLTTGDVCVEHTDRLARFGVPYVEAALESAGRKLHVLNQTESKQDLVQDFVDVRPDLRQAFG
jgi:putative resolvase